MGSRCKQCGELITKTGNYTFKILPAKRIPKKARRLVKAGEIGEEERSSSGSWGRTRFYKFLVKRSMPENVMELTCGKCGGVSKMKMLKPGLGAKSHPAKEEEEKGSNEDFQNRDSRSSAGGGTKRKKGKKDKMAGLTLLTASPVVAAAKKDYQPSSTDKVASPKKPAASNAQSKKELEKLKNKLFQSKKAKKSGSTLQDFLSSI